MGQTCQRTVSYICSRSHHCLQRRRFRRFHGGLGPLKLDGPKFKDAFKGNFIDLGTFRFISLHVVQSNGDTQEEIPSDLKTYPHDGCKVTLGAPIAIIELDEVER